MASQTQGIQQLLAAEKRAAEKVSEARKRKFQFCKIFIDFLICKDYHWNIFSLIGKQKRLKQAKEEAQDEIEKYRQERERQFKEFEAKVSFSLSSKFQAKSLCGWKVSENLVTITICVGLLTEK